MRGGPSSIRVSSEQFSGIRLELVLRRQAKDAIVNETLRFARRGLETNGMLLGNMRFNSGKGILFCEVITATDSGPFAEHQPGRTSVDTRYQTQRLEEAQGRNLSMLGFWHSHPRYITEPSSGDHISIRAAAMPLYISLITTLQSGESVPRLRGFAFYFRQDGEFIRRQLDIYMEKANGRFDFFDAAKATVMKDV